MSPSLPSSSGPGSAPVARGVGRRRQSSASAPGRQSGSRPRSRRLARRPSALPLRASRLTSSSVSADRSPPLPAPGSTEGRPRSAGRNWDASREEEVFAQLLGTSGPSRSQSAAALREQPSLPPIGGAARCWVMPRPCSSPKIFLPFRSLTCVLRWGITSSQNSY